MIGGIALAYFFACYSRWISKCYNESNDADNLGIRTMLSERLPIKMTVEEYLAYEQETGIKHEYIEGEIFAMAGGTRHHTAIITNCSGELREQVRKKPCQAYTSEIKVKVSDIKYVYPDFTVVCGEQKYADGAEAILTNPTLVGEVISPSSEDYDRGSKANFYRSLPSVQQYLLLNQDKPYAQLFTRNDIGWQLQEFEGLDAIIPLISIDCELKLSEAYLDVF